MGGIASVQPPVPIALSSGESEFYGSVKGASVLVGAGAMARDLGLSKSLRLFVDASAGMGIAQRRGAGKVRHIHTPALWIQRAIHNKVLSIHKCKGASNPADLGTKHLDAKSIWMCMTRLGYHRRAGQSKLTLRAKV